MTFYWPYHQKAGSFQNMKCHFTTPENPSSTQKMIVHETKMTLYDLNLTLNNLNDELNRIKRDNTWPYVIIKNQK